MEAAMKAQLTALILLGTTSLSAWAGSAANDMAARARESIDRNSAYEMVSIREFWGDASFMKDCARPNSPLPAAFTIYFEVLPSGQLGLVDLEPNTPVAMCIKQHVMGQTFTPPPGGVPYVTKIEMAFQQ
jgi:hypothetical protein